MQGAAGPSSGASVEAAVLASIGTQASTGLGRIRLGSPHSHSKLTDSQAIT